MTTINGEAAKTRITLGDALAAEALAAALAAEVEQLKVLLTEALEQGLIYWEPQTERGHIAKAGMQSRIRAALEGKDNDRHC